MTPEEKARQVIDGQFIDAGWEVQDCKALNFSAACRTALRKAPLKIGPSDYLLLVARFPVGVIEAKKPETTLSGVADQSADYNRSLLNVWARRRYLLVAVLLFETLLMSSCAHQNAGPERELNSGKTYSVMTDTPATQRNNKVPADSPLPPPPGITPGTGVPSVPLSGEAPGNANHRADKTLSAGASTAAQFQTPASVAVHRSIAVDIPNAVRGIWVVTGIRFAGISAMDEEEAKRWIGRSLAIDKVCVSLKGEKKSPNRVSVGEFDAERFFVDAFKIRPAAIGFVDRKVRVYKVQESSGSTWAAPGATIMSGGDLVLTYWDGVFFVLGRQPIQAAAPAPAGVAPTAEVRQEPDRIVAQPRGQSGWGIKPMKIAVLCLLPLVILLVVIVRYIRSDSVRARRKVRDAVNRFEEILLDQKKFSQEAQAAIAEAAQEYSKEVRRMFLQAISLDEVRKLAPGVRLQPLYASGIKSLLDCQGWNSANFRQLRGIGPDSAYRIWAACQALTKFANEQPIRHPSVSDRSASAKTLYARIYTFGHVQAMLSGQEAAIEGALQILWPKRSLVKSRTTFVHWLFGSESDGLLKQAIEEGKTVEELMLPDREMGQVLSNGMSRLAKAKATGQMPISYEDLIADIAKQEAFYRGALDNFLGPEPIEGNRTSPAGAAAFSNRPVLVQTNIGSPSGYTIPGAPGVRIEFQVGSSHDPSASMGPTQKAADCWVARGREVKVGGYTIGGGLLYIGRNLRSVNRHMVEPALIDPSLRIDRSLANYHVRMLSYWSSYSFAAPGARASYLQWLENGRNDPSADIGYVFLYFYGLERRALADAKDDPNAKSEISTILSEVRRLRLIYEANRSFARYSADFLEYLETTQAMQSGFIEAEEPPALERYHLSFDFRRKLGSFAVSGKPLPANWAYVWYHNDPRSRFSTAAERCPNHVASLFQVEYGRRFGEGLVLPAPKTQLKLTYKPASGSFGGPLISAINLPDVSVLSTIYAKLQAVAVDCFCQIDGYSRFIARNKGQENSFDALVLLPTTLWPEPMRGAVRALLHTAQELGTAHVVKFEDLLHLLPHAPPLTNSKYIKLCRALGALGLGIEPDVRFGGTLPSPEDPVAVYPSEITEKTTDGFGSAALLLQLASIVASADGDFSEPEAQKLRVQIEELIGLPAAEQQRLLARLATYRVKAPSTSGLKQTIKDLSSSTRSAVVDFLLTLVYADGVIAPAEVKAMESIYALFGMDAASLYTKLHALSAYPEGAEATAVQKTGVIQLDKAKIEHLKAVSAEVTKKLTIIFDSSGDQVEEAGANETAAYVATDLSTPSLLNLDTTHAELLAVLLGRSQWTRAEFEELCSDKSLMPDGAIERINEAAFARFDQALIEGEDPLEISSQLLLEEKTA
jgi:uncharacterized tellurite resistance protein B-like protein/predicted nucleic-acid-binding protein